MDKYNEDGMGERMNLLNVYTRFKKDLDFLEKQMEEAIHTDHELLSHASVHLLKAGGKRLRPIFVLLSGRFGDGDLSKLQHIAVPLELIHMATLVHDDVIDDADTRRGQLTVKSKWDNRIAMYTGDYIFAKALVYASHLGSPPIHQVLSKAIVEMCIGEMEQIRFFFRTDQTVKDYLLRIKRKTALLIAISCQLGAMAAGTPAWMAGKLYRYGYNVGMAFQIRDDILDLLGTEKELGKPPGSDVRQGNMTLPVLLALREEDKKAGLLAEIERIQAAAGDADVTPLLQLVRGSEGIQGASALADKYIDNAIQALSELPDNRAKRDLTQIAYFVNQRSN